MYSQGVTKTNMLASYLCNHKQVIHWDYPPGLYPRSGRTSYLKISWRLEAARFSRLFQSLWTLTGTTAAALSRYLSFFLSDTVIITLNTLRPRQDGRHLADDIFTCIFLNENCCNLIKFSLKYVRKGPIDNYLALVPIMAWRRLGDKPLSEPMMISLPTHICVTRPQWVNFAASRLHEILPEDVRSLSE